MLKWVTAALIALTQFDLKRVLEFLSRLGELPLVGQCASEQIARDRVVAALQNRPRFGGGAVDVARVEERFARLPRADTSSGFAAR